MLAKSCLSCQTPLTLDAQSCPHCGHILATHAPETTTKTSSHHAYHHLILGLLGLAGTLMVIFLLAYGLCLFYSGTGQDNRQQALASAIGNKEKLFLSERFASEESITLYHDMIDHELALAEEHGDSTLLDDRLPDDMQVVSARRLTEAYARNKFNADAHYRNRTLLVEARIDAVQNDAGATPCLLIRGKDALHDAQACLRDTPEVLQDIVILQPRSTQKLICRGESYVMTSTILGDCIPLVSLFRQRARELKRSYITHITRGQLLTRLRDTTHPLHHTKPLLLLLLRAEYGTTMFPECRHGWSSLCERRLRKVHDDELNLWLHNLFQENGILYGEIY